MRRAADWQIFEQQVLDLYGVGAVFTNKSLAEDWEITPKRASRHIDNYLKTQRHKDSKTKYVLVREGRTGNALWTVGRRARDARNGLGQFADDTRHRILRAVQPDLVRIGQINPQARKAVEQGLEPMVDGLVQVLVGVMGSVGWNGDESK